MNIIDYRIVFYSVSGALVAASIAALVVFGIPLGRDFTGGSLLELRYEEERPLIHEIQETFAQNGFPKALVQPTGADGFIIRLPVMSEEEHQTLAQALGIGIAQLNTDESNPLIFEERFDSIGPVIGEELKRNAVIALIVAAAGIILYIAWAFRKVSKPISSWKYGIVAVIALAHDTIIPAGVFAVLGHWYGVEVDMLFITALLTILGFSVHDTIVVFDRVREHLRGGSVSDFALLVNQSVNETLIRSLNTSLTVVLVLSAILFFGGSSTFYFVLALLIGVVVGTYSSIFIASPLLVTIERWRRK
ncbi:MAG: protein translocase subunit SecF [Patescibacteria group bacterium]